MLLNLEGVGKLDLRYSRDTLQTQWEAGSAPPNDLETFLTQIRIAPMFLAIRNYRSKIVGRPTTLRAVRIGQRRRQRRARCLKIDHPLPRLQRIPHRLEPLQSIR